ncbi:hypothetical protein DPMN_029130 [Dreissena polymorpha]|uniref:Uncharacterized protein n=1 Tax=Dreissena polymorpha TaxID=45954 RepID=A0A9D4LWM4_DREPO|nr:hypothetical protein DPMN_029130 [Dreissena polymorpha]
MNILTAFNQYGFINVASRAQNIIGTNKFHEDRKINVASRVYIRKNTPPHDGHVFQPTGIIFQLSKDTIRINLLTKFHEDWTVNVASKVLTRYYYRYYYSHIRKNAPPLGSHTNLLTKFHLDWTINVASRVLTRKNALPLFHDDQKINVTSRKINVTSRVLTNAQVGHVFQPTSIIFELVQYIIGILEINVASRVLTRKNDLPPGGHVFQLKGIISKLVQDIIGMNILTKFHEDWTINVVSRITRDVSTAICHPTGGIKNAPPLGSHVFQTKVTIFKLIQDIIGTNLLTKFHEDQEKMWPLVLTRKNAPPHGGHVFQPTGIIFELFQDIIVMNLLIKFHEDWTITVASRVLTRFYYSFIRKNALPLGSHVFQAKIIVTNLLIKFYEDQKINVASRVLTRNKMFGANQQTNQQTGQKQYVPHYYSGGHKNAPPPGDHVFQPTGIISELVQDIIGMNLLTKFHEDQTINVASRMKNAPPLGSHVFQANVTIFILIQDIIETNFNLNKFHED